MTFPVNLKYHAFISNIFIDLLFSYVYTTITIAINLTMKNGIAVHGDTT